MLFNSIRARLTMWYAGVLTLVLMTFAGATYAYLARTAQQRTDATLADTAHAFISNFVDELNDGDQPGESVAAEVAHAFRFQDRQVIILDGSRRVVASSDAPIEKRENQSWLALKEPARLAALIDAASGTDAAFATIEGARGGLRAIVAPVNARAQTYFVVVALSLHEQMEALRYARRAFLVAIPLTVLLASVGGYLLARKSLAPVVSMGKHAARLGSANLNERLPVANAHDEIGGLAMIFNDLLARLDQSFDLQRRFTADCSHELRTPVAIIRGEAEVSLLQPTRSEEEYRESLSIIHDESRRLAAIVDDLFMLARVDAGQYPLTLTDWYLDETTTDCVRKVRSLAQRHGLELRYRPPRDEIPFHGDEALIQRMILNLLHNAIKYTPPGGRISMGLSRQHGQCITTIEDTGVGIPAEAQPHIFERFYRVHAGTPHGDNGESGGAGLGLAIASWIAEKHGGRIVLERSGPDGSVFSIILPASP